MDNLDEFLNANEPEAVTEEAAPAAEAVEEAEPVKAEGPARGPDGKFIPKGEKADAPPASNEFDGAATLAERRKRQELERELETLRAQFQQLSNPPAPAPDMFENPEGWQGHFGQQVTQSAVSHASMNATLNTSEMLCRDKFDDFDDMKALFLDLAKENPTLAQQALNDGHPWRKAYQLAKNHAKMQTLGAVDVTELEAKLRAEIEAELKAAKPAPVELPTSLASAQSGSGPSVQQQTGYTSLEDILRR